MKYPMIEKLGLSPVIECKKHVYCVDASDLEQLLASAQTVYKNAYRVSSSKSPHDTHTAKLLCIEPIKHGVTKMEIVGLLKDIVPIIMNEKTLNALVYQDLADRIEAEGIIND